MLCDDCKGRLKHLFLGRPAWQIRCIYNNIKLVFKKPKYKIGEVVHIYNETTVRMIHDIKKDRFTIKKWNNISYKTSRCGDLWPNESILDFWNEK